MRLEPSFLEAVRVQGPFTQVGVVRDSQAGRAVGCGTRAVRSAYVNGVATNLGYLGALRLAPEARGGTLLAQGYRTFHRLHRDRRALLYLTTIPEENREARALLTSGRAGLPRYDDLGGYRTFFLHVGRAPPRGAAVSVAPAHRSQIGALEDCLHRGGRRRQFYPCLLAHELLSGAAHLQGLRVEDFFLASNGTRVVGAAALWDQTGLRQLVASGGRRSGSAARLVRGLWSKLRGNSPVPAPGSAVRYAFVSFVCVDEDDPTVLRAILGEMLRAASERGMRRLLLGLHEQDPLWREVMRLPHDAHSSRLYVVYWEDGAEFRDALDDRTPWLELAIS